MILTGEILQKVVPNITLSRAGELAAIFNDTLPKYGMNDADLFHEFIANVAHESGGFRLRKESLNYTRPERLAAVWPSRFTLTGEAGKRDARQWVNKPTELANLVYGGRMGNSHAGDGAAFVGGGYAQITGRDAYTLYMLHVNRRDKAAHNVYKIASLVQGTEQYAVDSSLWFFCEYKNLENLALQDSFRELVRRWNGGFVGMDDRMKYYERAKTYIK